MNINWKRLLLIQLINIGRADAMLPGELSDRDAGFAFCLQHFAKGDEFLAGPANAHGVITALFLITTLAARGLTKERLCDRDNFLELSHLGLSHSALPLSSFLQQQNRRTPQVCKSLFSIISINEGIKSEFFHQKLAQLVSRNI
jgi:hypothetical protein